MIATSHDNDTEDEESHLPEMFGDQTARVIGNQYMCVLMCGVGNKILVPMHFPKRHEKKNEQKVKTTTTDVNDDNDARSGYTELNHVGHIFPPRDLMLPDQMRHGCGPTLHPCSWCSSRLRPQG
eukprot:CAMPEP_0118724540 /NCGR_PEP_ID=MMETSP0800-20121206/32635_1 /TAXON_ID=210618 ORGANISM="Striatella unipunctata, Strain CCMP2910" /NCGR_SAMPLE_ID=MMETSP0800 /ASSEMBLY_ACC=CAM_ASM_000638 /LENGTH=123 /DNA_ID=CAMNT_0006633127 /DNA_START=454 /DNA_END=826 /DNA_ORIENTATION=-